MRKLIYLAVIVAACCGCTKDPLTTSKTNNSDFDVELLFEHDGCKMYRFMDSGRYIYFVKGGSSTEWGESHNTGKSSYTIPRRVDAVE